MNANDKISQPKAHVKLMVYVGKPKYDKDGKITNKLKEIIEYEDLPVEPAEGAK